MLYRGVMLAWAGVMDIDVKDANNVCIPIKMGFSSSCSWANTMMLACVQGFRESSS